VYFGLFSLRETNRQLFKFRASLLHLKESDYQRLTSGTTLPVASLRFALPRLIKNHETGSGEAYGVRSGTDW